MPSRAAFFFGSGIAYQSNAPDLKTITAGVLDGAWKPHSDWRFYSQSKNDKQVSPGNAPRAQQFLRIVEGLGIWGQAVRCCGKKRGRELS